MEEFLVCDRKVHFVVREYIGQVRNDRDRHKAKFEMRETEVELSKR